MHFSIPKRARIVVFSRTHFTVDYLGAARSNEILTIKSFIFRSVSIQEIRSTEVLAVQGDRPGGVV